MEHHYHHCPECYEKWKCQMECTIEYDLQDDQCDPGKQFGSHCICPECDTEALTKEFWNRYNGFIK